MAKVCSRCTNEIAPEQDEAELCPACKSTLAARPTGQVPEFDHRGIQLPARTRVGGIIIPQ